MRFLVDECTGPVVARWLSSRSHDVFSVFDDARGMTDDEVLAKAIAEQRILITNDKDFGEKGVEHAGGELSPATHTRTDQPSRAMAQSTSHQNATVMSA